MFPTIARSSVKAIVLLTLLVAVSAGEVGGCFWLYSWQSLQVRLGGASDATRGSLCRWGWGVLLTLLVSVSAGEGGGCFWRYSWQSLQVRLGGASDFTRGHGLKNNTRLARFCDPTKKKSLRLRHYQSDIGCSSVVCLTISRNAFVLHCFWLK